jgi:hypothetical protein
MSDYIEVISGVREDLADIIREGEGSEAYDALSNRLKKFLSRPQGSTLESTDGSNRWFILRVWGDMPAGGPDAVVSFLEQVYTDEWHWLRPFSPAYPPAFPWNHSQVLKYFPPLLLGGEWDEDGNEITPPTEYLVIHDGRPTLMNVGQFKDSKGGTNFLRRVYQVTSNQNLDAQGFFGVPAWAPQGMVVQTVPPEDDLDSDGLPDTFLLSEL